MAAVKIVLAIVLGALLGIGALIACTLGGQAVAHSLWGPHVDGGPAGFSAGALVVIFAAAACIIRKSG